MKPHSAYRGVTFHKPSGRWIAECRDYNGKLHQKYFLTEREAAEGYDTLATSIRGNDVTRNFQKNEIA